MSPPSHPAAPPDDRPAAPLRVELVESLDALAAHEAAWHGLLEAALPGRGFFYRLPMLRAMAPVHAPAQHPGGRRSPFFLLAWRGEALVGGLPLVLERKRVTRAGVRRLLAWAGDGSAVGAETDVPMLGDAAARGEIAAAFRHALLAGPGAGRFDLLDVQNFREDSPARPALEAAFADGRWQEEPFTSHHVALDGDFASYRAGRSGSRLRELGRLRRRLEGAHTVEIREVERLTDAELEAVMRLHGARQSLLASRGERREAVFGRHAAALRTLLDTAADVGRTRHRLLLADGEVITFLLGFLEGDTFIAWLTAVHADYLPYGPGGVLFWEVVQREFARGEMRRIEFGFGTTFVKQTMSTHGLRPRQLQWHPPGRALARLRWWAYGRLVALRESGREHRSGG